MKRSIATMLTAAVATTALLLALAPAPALAEVTDEVMPDEQAMTVDDGLEEPADAEQTTDPAQAADATQDLIICAQSDSDDKGWTSEDTKKLSNVLLNVGKGGLDIGMIILGAGNPALMATGINNLVSDTMGWLGLGAYTGPTMTDVMDGLNAIEYRLTDIDKRLADVEYGVSVANCRSLIESANDLATYCSEVEQMLDADHLAQLGLEPLPKGATPEQANAWREQVVQAILAAEQNRTAGFIQYEGDMTHIKQLFAHVANIVAQPTATNPIPLWDSLWENYYNWETQAWGPKQALRTSITTSLTRAYGLLALYLRIYEDPDHVETTLSTQLLKALKQVSSMPAGTNPATIDLQNGGFSVRSYTLNKCATKWKATCYVNEGISGVSGADIQNYLSRLHGHTVLEDLELAGLAYDLTPSDNDAVTQHYSTKRAGDRGSAGLPVVGLAYHGDWNDSGSAYSASILLWSGSTSSKTTVTGTNTAAGTYFLDLGLR